MVRLEARRIYWIILFCSGVFSSILFTLDMVYFVEIVDLDPLQLVLVGTTLETSVLLFEVPTGVVADVYSRRLSVIVGTLLMGIGFMLEGLVPAFGVILAAQVVWGFGWTFISGARSAWIADEVGQEQVGAVFLRGTQATQLGSLLGIPVSVLLGRVALNLPLLIGGGLYVLLGLFLMLFMPETGFSRARPEERQSWSSLLHTLQGGLRLMKQSAPLLSLLLISLFLGLSSEGYDRLWTAHILQDYSFPALGSLGTETWFGIMRAGSMLLTLGATELVRQRQEQVRPQKAATILQLVSALMVGGLVLLALTGNIWLAIFAYWLIETARRTAWPLFEALINRFTRSEVRATVLSAAGQVDAFGQIAGGPAVGYIGSRLSLRHALMTAAFLVTPVVYFYGRMRRSSPEELAAVAG